MRCNRHGHARAGLRRRGLAAVELATLLPMLCFLMLITVDYARLLHATVEITAAARNGSLYGSDPNIAASTGDGSIQIAALAETTDLSPTPTVASASGTDSNGDSYVEVTVSYTFSTLVTYPGIPSPTTISRKIRMPVAPP